MKAKTIIVLLLIPLAALAQPNFKKVGSAGYVFLTIPVGARTASMGEAAVALSDLGPEALFVNPGSLGFSSPGQKVSFAYSPWIAETRHEAVAYVWNGGNWGFLGIGIVRLDMGEIQGYRDPPSDVLLGGASTGPKLGEYDYTGVFTADAMALGVTYGRRLTEKFSFGVTGKFVQERIDAYISNNIVFDGGMLYETGFGSLRVGGVVRNFGVESKYLEGVFKMPADFRFGAAMEIIGSAEADQRVTVTTEFLHPTDNDERINVGLEYCFDRAVFLRGGYKFFYDEESWSAGGGILWRMLSLDASYADLGRLGGNTRITLGITL